MSDFMQDDNVLEVHDLKVSFRTDEGRICAVDGVSFAVKQGKVLGIVGESGSGKSVATKAIVQLLPATAEIDPGSKILLRKPDGGAVDLARLQPTSREIRAVRGDIISMIFQEPMSSFSPVYTIGNHIIEAIRAHRKVDRKEAKARAIDLLDKVGISDPATRVDQYPFELSGGMRQRAMIAVALAANPSVLIADEPTTALDVTIQAQILELLRDLQAQFNMAIIFISHDLGVISQVADEVAVMYLGRILERGNTREIIKNPQHPYTQALLRAIPRLDVIEHRLLAIGGSIPNALERPTGCPFHTRCPQIIRGVCDVRLPASTLVSDIHRVECFLYEDVEVQTA